MSLRYLSGNKLSTKRLNSSGATVSYSGVGDLNYGQTSLLLHGDGTNGAQNNTFLDSSSNGFSITRNGNTTQGTFSPFSLPDGQWSNYFNGSSSYLTAPYYLNVGTGSFTVEGWFYITSFASNQCLWYSGNGGGSTPKTYLYVNTSGNVSFAFQAAGGTAPIYQVNIGLQLNQWSHIACVKNGTTLTIYLNGSSVATATGVTASVTGITNPFYIGYSQGGDGDASVSYMNGYCSNLRVNTTAVYTSNFTAPTTPLTAIANTSLLTCQSSGFKDNSTNAFAITPSGSPSVQAFSPFAPTAAYSATTNGGSGYFDGSGDYLTAPANTAFQFGTGDLTIECFAYRTTSGTTNTLMQYGNASVTNYNDISWSVFISSSNYATFEMSNGSTSTYITLTSNTLWPLNSWVHIAVVRSGNNFTMYQNGASVATGTTSQSFYTPSTPLLWVGRNHNAGTGDYSGYISNNRVVKGTAVYTSTFAPPTSPLTAITNTQLLLSFTNAGIIDNTQTNNLETVGNISISTTQKKFGTASMYFDASSSYLKCPSNPNVAFGTGDFTIEYWMYSNDVSSSTQKGIFQTSDTAGGLKTSYTTGILMGQGYSGGNLSGAIRAIINNTEIGSSVAVLTTGVWYHIALVRVSGVVTIYVNGNSVASGTISSSIDGTNLAVGGYYNTSYTFNGYIDDFRITKGVARYLYNFIPPTIAHYDNGYSTYTPPSNDSYFGSTSLLLHGDGSSGTQNQTFLDSSTNAFTITRNGNATQGTFSPFSREEGYWSNYFDGSSYLTVSGSSSFSGTGDFTFECWAYPTSNPSYQNIMGNSVSGGLGVIIESSGVVSYSRVGVTIVGTTTIKVAFNQWNHIAVVRSSGVIKMFINGQLGYSGSETTNFSLGSIQIGADYGTNSKYYGYISNVRITNTVLYTSNFTPSTTPLTSITNTALLTCQSNRFKDNSTNAFAITTSGSPQVQTFIPFEPTTAYSAATNGGSAYFDGTGDYLSVADNSALEVGSSNFTAEAWVYLSSSSQVNGSGIISKPASSSYSPYMIGIYPATGALSMGASLTGSAWDMYQYDSVAFPLYTWVHVAMVRSGNTFTLYKNGVSVATGTLSGSLWDNTETLKVGWLNYASTSWPGYITDTRLVIGTAVYTGAFTPPTAPLTAITNTRFLCNCQNAGIIDNTASNVLETVGNAQASAVQYKYGTGSMYFPGSSYLLSSVTPNFALGSADFTIEFWIYYSGSTAGPLVALQTGPGNTVYDAIFGYINSSSAVQMYLSSAASSWDIASGVSISPANPSGSQWYHVAVTRYRNTFRTFWNGNQTSTFTSSASIYQSANQFCIGSAQRGSAPSYMLGYIDDFRFTKGVSRYNYNFQPPTSAYPDY